VREREKERERDRERDTEREKKERERQIERKKERETQREKKRQRNTEKHIERGKSFKKIASDSSILYCTKSNRVIGLHKIDNIIHTHFASLCVFPGIASGTRLDFDGLLPPPLRPALLEPITPIPSSPC